MAWRWVSWGGVVLAGLLLAVVGFVAWHDGHEPRLQTVRQLVRDLDEHGG
jgi:lipopolysaccharide export system protein LptC